MTEKDFVEWRPEWSPEEEKQVEAAVAYLRDRVSNLRAFREALGLSQNDLSKLLETTQSNVSKIEAKNDPRLSILRKIVEGKGGRLKVVAEFDGRELELPL